MSELAVLREVSPAGGHDHRHSGESTLIQSIGEIAGRRRHAEAIVDGAVRITYGALFERASRVASALRAARIAPGEIIGLFLDNCADHLEVILGALVAGVVPLPFRPDVTDALLHRQDSVPLKAVFISANRVQEFRCMQAGGILGNLFENRLYILKGKELVGPDRDFSGYQEFLERGSLPETIHWQQQPNDLMMADFTAGTTGAPKLCPVTHAGLTSKMGPFASRLNMSENARVWLPLPINEGGFLFPFLAALSVGATVVMQREFDPVVARTLLRDERITHALPYYLTHWIPVLEDVDFWPSDCHFLTHVCLLGPTQTLMRLQKALPQATLLTAYGSTELGGIFCMPCAQDVADIRLNTVGRPFGDHDIRIVDPSTTDILPADQIGEIQARAPGWPQATGMLRSESVMAPDGWLRTGDLGAIDTDGCLKYHGRLIDMISVGDDNLSAIAVEGVIARHPGVAMVQVVGIPDLDLGQVIAAFVEMRPGCDFDPEAIAALCRNNLPPGAAPRYISPVESWPTVASKISKSALRQVFLIEDSGD